MESYLIGERLRSLRKERHLTQDDLANLMSVSRVQVNQWETGAREIASSRIIKLAEIFNTSCDYLMRGVESEAPPPIVPVPEKNQEYGENETNVHIDDASSAEKNSAEEKTDVFHDKQESPSSYRKSKTNVYENSDMIILSSFSKDSLKALRVLYELDSRKKEQYIKILNGFLGADSFWKVLMPAAAAALTVKEQSAFGGLSEDRPALPDDLEEKLKSSEEIVKLGNSVGYMNSLLISNEQAYYFQIQEASRAFKNILDGLISRNTLDVDSETKFWTESFKENDSKEDKNSEFKKFFKLFGLDF